MFYTLVRSYMSFRKIQGNVRHKRESNTNRTIHNRDDFYSDYTDYETNNNSCERVTSKTNIDGATDSKNSDRCYLDDHENGCTNGQGHNEYNVVVHKTTNGIGLSIIAAKGVCVKEPGTYVKAVIPGGAASKTGKFHIGDQLLSVDGQSLSGITQQEAASILTQTGTVLTLRVSKGAGFRHGLGPLLALPSPDVIKERRKRRHRNESRVKFRPTDTGHVMCGACQDPSLSDTDSENDKLELWTYRREST